MSSPFSSVLFQLPSVQRFLDLLVDDLSSRRSLLVLLPLGIDPGEVWSSLRANLWRREFSFEEVSLPRLPRDRTPVAAIGDVLQVDWPSSRAPRTVASLTESKKLPDVVQLDGLDQLSGKLRGDWFTFLVEWTRACQNVADRGHPPTALCVMTPAVSALSQLPQSGIHLAVHWWWGFPSALETQLLCRVRSENNDWTAAARWREHLLPALAGSDATLVDYLWNDSYSDMDSLTLRLNSFAEQRGWEVETLQAWGAEGLAASSGYNHGSQLLSPPAQWHNLWAHGAMSWTLEYGVELNTAALALLRRTDALRHRLWRGQAELFLPSIDQIRLTLCEHLTRSYGRDWPVRWHQPASPEEDAAVRNSPLACQWGYLEWLLKNCFDLRHEQRLLSLVSLSRWIRNEMAHYRPVAYRDYEAFWRETVQIANLGILYR